MKQMHRKMINKYEGEKLDAAMATTICLLKVSRRACRNISHDNKAASERDDENQP